MQGMLEHECGAVEQSQLQNPVSGRRGRPGLMRVARRPLTVMIGTSILGTLAFLSSHHDGRESDMVLVWTGWVFYVVTAGSAFTFAARSGSLREVPGSDEEANEKAARHPLAHDLMDEREEM